jgi:predicted RNA polymerase sigma factor
VALYGVLEHVSPGPIVRLNRAVAVSKVHGPQAGLALLEARQAYLRAARLTANIPEQRYLIMRASDPSGL